MATLRACIKKAGKALSKSDGDAITELRDDYLKNGLDGAAAANAAVDEYLGMLQEEARELGERVAKRGGDIRPVFDDLGIGDFLDRDFTVEAMQASPETVPQPAPQQPAEDDTDLSRSIIAPSNEGEKINTATAGAFSDGSPMPAGRVTKEAPIPPVKPYRFSDEVKRHKYQRSLTAKVLKYKAFGWEFEIDNVYQSFEESDQAAIRFVQEEILPRGPGWRAKAARAKKVGGLPEAPGNQETVLDIDMEESLSTSDREVQQRFADKLQAPGGLAAAEAEYAALPQTKGGRALNVDDARELSEDYLQNRSGLAAAVHEPASAFIKYLYAKKLNEGPALGQDAHVVFTAGGTGAGKTTGLILGSKDYDAAQVIFDTNMPTFDSAKKKVEQALEAGKEVTIMYVYRDPVDALVNGALPRAMRQEKEFGSGRTVPIFEHAKTHAGSNSVIRQLSDEYADDSRVHIDVVMNNLGRGNARSGDLQEVPDLEYNSVLKDISAALEEAYSDGRISEAVYNGFNRKRGEIPAYEAQPDEAQDTGQADGQIDGQVDQPAGGVAPDLVAEPATTPTDESPTPTPGTASEGAPEGAPTADVSGVEPVGGTESVPASEAPGVQRPDELPGEPIPTGTDTGADEAGGESLVVSEPGIDSTGTDTAEPGVQRGGGSDAAGAGTATDRGRRGASSNYSITDADEIGAGGLKAKFKANVAAIKLLKEINSPDRGAMQGIATPEEQAVLVKYVGWGGMPQAFDKNSKQWKKEYAELLEVLAPPPPGRLSADRYADYQAARASTPNAHYTSPTIIRGMYSALEHMGYKGRGRILEPAAGVGHFIGLMPESLRAGTQFKAIELDNISGQIAALLYPRSSVVSSRGFQEIEIADESYDLAIGNPPFGDEKLYDARHKDLKSFSIHNFFIAKSLAKTRPGGVLAMVVSNSFLDKAGGAQRAYIAKQADFLGAIRLPNNAFKGNANTEVTTDIIFLQKREEGTPAGHESWSKIDEVPSEEGAIPLNEYFARHPDMMLGSMELAGSMYGPAQPALVAPAGQDLQAALDEAIAKLPIDVYQDTGTSIAEVEEQTLQTVPPGAKIYSFHVSESGNAIVQRMPDDAGSERVVVSHLGTTKVARLKSLIGVRDHLNALMESERDPASTNADLKAARKELNTIYDAHVKRFGAMNTQGNKLIMREDPDFPRLLSLEHDFEPAISPAVGKKRGVKPRKAQWKKADIFKRRVLQPYQEVTSVDSAQDGMAVSMNELGRVDIPHIAGLLGNKSEADVIEDLKGLIFKDGDEWVTHEEYLSGNVKRKLKEAQAAGVVENIEALEEVQPADKEPLEIKVGLGATWIPPADVEAFINKTLEAQSSVKYVAGQWVVNILGANRVLDTDTWGTLDFPASKMIGKILANKEIKVMRRAGDGTSYTDKEATIAAQQKGDELRRAFNNSDTGEGWLWEDAERRERVAAIYNEQYNTHRTREHYDGSYLTLPGLNATKTPHPHVVNAVARILQEGRMLADHAVGAGKTWVAVIAAMEMRRIGLAKKPMVVVPNHLVGQWAREFMDLYPNAKVLQTTKNDFKPENRKVLMSKIATGDWDAVIVAHSQFTMIPVPGETETRFITAQVKELQEAIDALKENKGENRRTIKQMEKAKTKMTERMKAIADKEVDDTVNFSELGVDALFLDEAHEYKNLFYSTQMQRVGGLGSPNGAKKSFDMFMKVRMIQDEHDQKGVVFLTGTPISNSMVEMFTMQRYMQYKELEEKGLQHFDAWASVFGNMTTDWELDATGTNYKMKTRFRSFQNMHQLQSLYRSFADVMLLSDLKEMTEAAGKVWPVPKLKGGEVEQIVVPRSPEQAAFMAKIIDRMQNMPSDPREDNHLAATNDARKMALDMRMVDAGARDHLESKSSVVSQRIYDLYQKWNEDKGTQLVFIDLSTPKDFKSAEAKRIQSLMDRAEQGDEDAQTELSKVSMDEILATQSQFDMYNDIKSKLIDMGIPADEVRFAHEATTELKLAKLHADVRSGAIRVLIGSTKKMGTGTNVQDRLVGLFNVDAPWRPADIEQRIGRIVRQGNKLYERDPEGFEIEVANMATKQTYDARMWEILQQKAEVIEQVRAGNAGDVVDDITSGAATFSEMKAAATGNPLIQEQVRLAQEVRELEIAASSHTRSQHRLEGVVRNFKGTGERSAAKIAGVQRDIERRDAARNQPWSLRVGDTTYTVRTEKTEEETATAFKKEQADTKRDGIAALQSSLLNFVKDQAGNKKQSAEMGAFSYAGFEGDFNWHGNLGLSISLDTTLSVVRSYDGSESIDPGGLLTSLGNELSMLEIRIGNIENQAADAKKEFATAQAGIGKPFERADELDAKREQLKEIMTELQRMQDPAYVPVNERDPDSTYDEKGRLLTSEPNVTPGDKFTVQFARTGEGETTPAVPRMTHAEVEAAIAPQLEAVSRETELDVRVVHSNELPDEITAEIEPGDVAGVLYNNTVYLVTDGLKDALHAQKTFAHEVIGHMGVWEIIGDSESGNWQIMRDRYDALRRSGSREFESIRAELDSKYGSTNGQSDLDWLTEVSEFIALAAERRVDRGAVAEFMQWVRGAINRGLRRLGFDRAFNMSDINDLLEQSEERIMSGAPTTTAQTSFSRMDKLRKGKDRDNFTDKENRVIDHGGFGLQTRGRSFKQRFADIQENKKTRFRQYWIDQYDSIRTILKDDRAWMKAQLTASSWGSIEAGIEYGHLGLHEDGVITVDTDEKSLKELLAPLGEDLDRFLYWIAGNRADKLLAEERENLFNQAQIDVLKGMGEDGVRGEPGYRPGRRQLFELVRQDFEAFGDAITKVAVDTGLVNEEEAEQWREEGFYLPFYRVLDEDENAQGPRTINNIQLVRQVAYKRLKGGKHQLDDLLGNALMNWNHLLSASLKNQAAREALASAEELGIAERVSPKNASKDAVFVKVDGKQQWWELSDDSEGQLVLQSLTAMHYNGMQGPFWKLARKAKRAQTIGVTASPEFKIANLMRDTIQAIAVTQMDPRFYKNVSQGWKATRKNEDGIYPELLASGAVFAESGYIHGADPDAIRYLVRKGVERDTFLDTRMGAKRAFDAYQDFGARFENLNRASDYIQMGEQGLDRLERAFGSRDHLDFTRRGAGYFAMRLASTVSFMNARIQGIDKAARSMSDPKQRGRFAAVVGSYSLLSVALYLLASGEDDWDEIEDWERDTYHLFKMGGTWFRIPRPFEVGAMANMIERGAEQFFDDDVQGKVFAERLGHTLWETFKFQPIPQLFTPTIELLNNRNWFLDRPIESTAHRMSGVSKSRRANRGQTSETSIAISTGMEEVIGQHALSPVQIDHLINGYFAWAGMTVMAGVDMLATRPLTDAPDRPATKITEYPVLKRFVKASPKRNTKYTTAFYDQMEEVNRVWADIQLSRREGDPLGAMAILNENEDLLETRSVLNSTQQMLSAINAQRRLIFADKDMGAKEKRRQLDELQVQKNELVELAVDTIN